MLARVAERIEQSKAKPDPVSLADRVFAALGANDYGVFDGLVTVMLQPVAKRVQPAGSAQ